MGLNSSSLLHPVAWNLLVKPSNSQSNFIEVAGEAEVIAVTFNSDSTPEVIRHTVFARL
jgi:hypothetical protein